jgi:hypothetical protein
MEFTLRPITLLNAVGAFNCMVSKENMYQTLKMRKTVQHDVWRNKTQKCLVK